jgi:uncharacterized protein YndB with AHSA1/START domain
MMAATQQIVINAPADLVFAYVSDITKHPEWTNPGHKVEIKKTSEGPVAQGSTFEHTGQQFGEQHDIVTIKEFVPPQRLVYEADGSAGLIRHIVTLAPAEGGTQVTKTFEIVKPKFPLNILAPLVNAFLQPAAIRKDLGRMKAKLEGS